ncbi:MAG TPA: cell division protein ZapA [Candidatus Desulfovibrio intestinipullorum]|uniref:Cell division protein ZapA n=1 Tax=Candidatus Desulfovibrio intestinipullorum TaxID=2838536 RepID=A0A9D1TP18_9BACT|nr:cell division protein ZapA [Candidatus Desulfovibrio intestinipullorum]
MTSDNTTIILLGIPFSLKAGAEQDRIREAVELVEKRYEDQIRRTRSGLNKESLLTFTALGLADELLQLQKQHQEMNQRLEKLLSYIEQSK